MKVADAMTGRDDLVTASLPGTREDILTRLQEQSFSSVPILKEDSDGETYRGLISREDLIDHPDEDQIALLMRDVPTTTPSADITDVASLIVDADSRRIPVVDGGLEGIITVTDIVKAIADGEVEGDATVGDVARADVNATYQGAPLEVAMRELYYANVPYAIVLDEIGEMAGILTEVDVLEVAQVVEGEAATGESIANQDDEWMWEGIKAVGNRYLPTRNVEVPDEPVESYMSSEVLTVSRRTDIKEAAQIMIANDIEQLPMLSGDELVGVVMDIDLLKAL